MDPERSRIEEDLKGELAGDVRCDDITAELYSSDASIYELRPLGVVRPRSVDDVAHTVRYASENKIPLHARGAGSGLAGDSLGRGLVVDFSSDMRRILHTGDDFVRIQSGVVHAKLNEHLAQQNRLFGPDPSTGNVSTMGGCVSVDSSGSHWLKYGSARKHVRSMQVVLSSGEVAELNTHATSGEVRGDESPEVRRIVRLVTGLLQKHSALITKSRPQSLVNRSGYDLFGTLDTFEQTGSIDLAKLIAGSEGTLALITELTVDTEPLPNHRGCVLLLFDSLDKAARATLALAPLEPSACDLMDRRHLSLAREIDIRFELLIPPEAESVLLVEFSAETEEELQHQLKEAVRVACEETELAAAAHVAEDRADFEVYWSLAQRYVPTLYRLKGSRRPVPGIEDIAIPPAALPVFFRHLQDTLKQLQITASVFAHAGHGQLHIRPFLNIANREDIRRLETLANEMYERVWLLGGTISGEHGDGMSRTPFLARQYGPLVNVFRELKRIFDPEGILNPGKIVPALGSRMTHNVRRVVHANSLEDNDLSGSIGADAFQPRHELPPDQAKPASLPPALREATKVNQQLPKKEGSSRVALQLDWSPDQAAKVARECNGCAACRTQAEDTRMCPIFRFAPREEATPRAKANLMRAVLTDALPSDSLLQDACKEVADLCVNCHMCRLECPANVDIPKLMLEAKSTYVQTNGLPLRDRMQARVDWLTATAGRFSRLANWALTNRQARWVLEKLLGIAQGRKLPRLASRTFLQTASGRGLHKFGKPAPDKVIYFVDTFANHCDTQLAESFVAVLEHNDVSVTVPSDQRHSAMPMITLGSLASARKVAEQNVAMLAEAVRQGYTIVATEPSAALALSHEYPVILDNDEDALLVAQNTQEACTYLWKLHQTGRLRLDFNTLELTVGYHVPCHVRALEVGVPAENLLRLIPGVQVNRLEKGCSGMAGTFGLQAKNYRSSLRAGWDLISAVRTEPFVVCTTECSTCKMQMEQASTKPTHHPIKIIAQAYGLLPDGVDLAQPTTEELVIS